MNSSFEPNFADVFSAEPGRPPRWRSFSAESKHNKATAKFNEFLAKPKLCCRRGCLWNFLSDPDLKRRCLSWRREWHFTPQRSQSVALLKFHARIQSAPFGGDLRDTGDPRDAVDPRDAWPKLTERRYEFLGQLTCRRAWNFLTGISNNKLTSTRAASSRGEVDWSHRGFHRHARIETAMASAIWDIVHGCREIMPLKVAVCFLRLLVSSLIIFVYCSSSLLCART